MGDSQYFFIIERYAAVARYARLTEFVSSAVITREARERDDDLAGTG